MKLQFFNKKVSRIPKYNADDSEIENVPLFDMLFTDEFKEEVEAIRSEPDEGRQKEMKKGLPLFFASGEFDSNCGDGLVRHSGFICVDIDEKDNRGVKNFGDLKKAIRKIPFVAYCGRSVRGKGYFALIPIADPARHGDHFRSLVDDFGRCGLTIDKGCGDVCRKRFVSYDPDPYVNTGAEVYDRVLTEEVKPKEIDGEKDMRQNYLAEAAKFISTLEEIESRGIDITDSRDKWWEILCAIASSFGEAGRGYAHRVSRFYGGYSYDETDGKFDDALRHGGYGYTIATFFHHAKNGLSGHDFDGIINTDMED